MGPRSLNCQKRVLGNLSCPGSVSFWTTCCHHCFTLCELAVCCCECMLMMFSPDSWVFRVLSLLPLLWICENPLQTLPQCQLPFQQMPAEHSMPFTPFSASLTMCRGLPSPLWSFRGDMRTMWPHISVSSWNLQHVMQNQSAFHACLKFKFYSSIPLEHRPPLESSVGLMSSLQTLSGVCLLSNSARCKKIPGHFRFPPWLKSLTLAQSGMFWPSLSLLPAPISHQVWPLTPTEVRHPSHPFCLTWFALAFLLSVYRHLDDLSWGRASHSQRGICVLSFHTRPHIKPLSCSSLCLLCCKDSGTATSFATATFLIFKLRLPFWRVGSQLIRHNTHLPFSHLTLYSGRLLFDIDILKAWYIVPAMLWNTPFWPHFQFTFCSFSMNFSPC